MQCSQVSNSYCITPDLSLKLFNHHTSNQAYCIKSQAYCIKSNSQWDLKQQTRTGLKPERKNSLY